MKTLNIPLEESEYDRLSSAKGDRTWKQALIEELAEDE